MLQKTLFELIEAQKRIWYTQMLYPQSSMYNIGGIARINGKINVSYLKEAIIKTIHLYDALSIRFTNDEGKIFQYFDDEHEPNIEIVDFRNDTDSRSAYEQWLNVKLKELFVMYDKPLYDIVIIKFGEREFGYFIKMHHIISDGWSIQMFTRKMCDIYDAIYNNVSINLSNTSYSYRDYMISENNYIVSNRYQKNEEFWLKEFKNAPCIAAKLSNEVLAKRKTCEIGVDNSDRIYRFCKSNNVSLNSFFISIYLLANSLLHNMEEDIISIPLLGRNNPMQMKTFGMFVALIPLRYKLEKDSTFNEYLFHLNKKLKSLYLRQRYPYNHLIKALDNQNKQFHMLNNVCINYYNTLPSIKIQGFDITSEEFFNGEQDYSLQIIIRDWNDNHQIQVDFDYKISIYSDEDIQTLYSVMNLIMEQILDNPQLKINELNLISEELKYHIINEFNNTMCWYPKDKSVIELFIEQTIKTPDRVAIEEVDKALTYEQLNEKSTQFAQYLIDRGVSPNDIVCLFMSNSIEAIVSILAIMKIGAVYSPIDISYPKDRTDYILNITEAKVIISNQESLRKKYENVLIFDDAINFHYKGETLPEYYDPESLAYIIFTSGSTGNPKGVMVKRKGLTNYIWWAKKQYIDDIEVFPLFTSLAFDLTVTSVFTPLISGGKIRVYSNEKNQFQLFNILNENQCTVIKLTPAHLILLANEEYRASKIKRIIVGGDKLGTNLAHKIQDIFGNNIEIFNEYGPTETVVGCMIHKFNSCVESDDSVSIGKPIDNMQVYILNSNLKPLPLNVPGEMYIAGDGLAKGYLKNATENRSRFVKNPFLENQLMYRTGDIGIFTDLNNMKYISRKDNQIKLNGYRIELSEIELCIIDYDGINEVVVMKGEEDQENLIKLIAYYTAEKVIDELALREYCLRKLPHYMCPNVYMQIESFPLNQNGKIDKSKLQVAVDLKVNDRITKNSDKINILIKSLTHILGVRDITPQSNYFLLGGDSITAIQVSSELMELGISLKAKDILLYPVLNDMVCYMSFVNKVDRKQEICYGSIRNTPIVNWFMKQNFYNPNYYNQSIILRLNFSFVDIKSLKDILFVLIRHHDALRMNYDSNEKRLFYNNSHLDESIIIEQFHLSNLTKDEYIDKFKQIRYQMQSAFQIERSLLVKTCVIKNRNNECIWFLTFHHLVVDGVSLHILMNDINSLLEKKAKKQELRLTEKTVSYLEWARYIDQQREKVLDNNWNYYETEEYNYRIPYSNKGEVGSNKVTMKQVVADLSVDELLINANSIYHTTTEELVITAFIRALYLFYPKEYIVLDIENNGRNLKKIDVARTVGWFTSIYPVRFHIHDDALDSLIKVVKETMRNISEIERLYGLFHIENESKHLNHSIKLNYLGQAAYKTEYMEILDSMNDDDSDERNITYYDLEINVVILNRKTYVNFVFDSKKYEIEQMQKLLNKCCEQMKEVVTYCMNKNTIEFTPSDFDTLDITQEELDSLFC